MHGRAPLALMHRHGFVSHLAHVSGIDISLGERVLIGDNVIASDCAPGTLHLDDGVQLYGDTLLQSGHGGRLQIGAETHIQPGCVIYAHISDIHIGKKVEIAARCALYSYDHGVAPRATIMDQPLTSKGPIVIGDGAWLGHGVTVLAGVRIGNGAVIGAGSVVTHDIPANAIAVGNPARVLRSRGTLDSSCA
jgi:acetyltransferase-like isoleucine patch superfamily enzyme